MKRYTIILFALLLLGFHAEAQKAQVKADTNAILIGEQVQLDISYELPSNQKPLFPVFKDTITAQLEIVSSLPVDTIINTETGILTLKQQLAITSFDTGYIVIPAIPFGYYSQGDTSYQITESEPLLLNVFTVEVDTTKDIKPIVRPIAQPYTIDEFLPWILFGFALVAIIFSVFYFIRRRKKNKPLFAKKEKPALPPYEEAMLAFEELKRQKLWQQDRLKEYHTRLTDIIRQYIERRFDIPAIEMVTFDIMEELNKTNINKEVLAKLQASFELADLIKFAKSGATAIENDTSLNNGIDFINETKENVQSSEKEVADV